MVRSESREYARYAVQYEGKNAMELPGFGKRKIRVEIAGDYLQARSIATAEQAPIWQEQEPGPKRTAAD